MSDEEATKRIVTTAQETVAFDWSAIPEILRVTIQRTREHIATHQLYIGWEKNVERMRRAELVLERICADDYFSNSGDATRALYMYEQDIDYLCSQLKHMRGWWC